VNRVVRLLQMTARYEKEEPFTVPKKQPLMHTNGALILYYTTTCKNKYFAVETAWPALIQARQ